MIQYCKVPELEQTEVDYKQDRKPSAGTVPTQTSNP